MANKWIEHVKEYAKKHNISYACALSHPDLKKEYQPVVKKTYKQKREEKEQIIFTQLKNKILSKIKNMTEDDKPLIKMKFNSLNNNIKEDIKNNHSKYYNKFLV